MLRVEADIAACATGISQVNVVQRRRRNAEDLTWDVPSVRSLSVNPVGIITITIPAIRCVRNS
jgi:hypothetical protein